MCNMMRRVRLGSSSNDDDIFTSGSAEPAAPRPAEVPARKKSEKRRSSLAVLRKDSCKVA